ncbi:MAG: hypothetical protein IH945_02450 [Armatimonadetes bacterium]|nr:hypothetical protein [Armatimonadota bacterium]
MSVANLRSSFEKKGCRIALWILMVGAAFAIAGTGFMSCFAARQGQTRNPALDIEVLSVNGQAISLAAVTAETENRRLDPMRASQILAFGGITEPYLEFQAMATALDVLVRTSVVGSLARSRGVTVDDAGALAMRGQQLDDDIRRFRAQAVIDGDLLPDATEQEFQDHFLATVGRSASEFKQERLDDFRTHLDHPEEREVLLAQSSGNALSRSFYSSTSVTEDEVRRSYETLSLQVISFDDLEMSLEQRRAEAEKAMEELDGGASFDAVMRKYMEIPVTEPVEYSRRVIDGDEQLEPLNGLELGQNDRILLNFGTVPTIYRLAEVKSDLPEDFDANMDSYSDQLRAEKSGLALEQAIMDGIASAEIKWSSPGYEAIYNLSTAPRNPDLSEEEVEAYVKQVIDTTFARNEDPGGPNPAVLARYVAMEQLLDRLSEDERKEMLKARVEVILEVLIVMESVSLRLTLVDLYGEQELREDQAAALLMAAERNGGIDLHNQNYFNQINEKLALMEAADQIDSGIAAEISVAQLRWSEDMATTSEALAGATSDLDRFNIDPETGELIGSGDGTDPDQGGEGDSDQSGSEDD